MGSRSKIIEVCTDGKGNFLALDWEELRVTETAVDGRLDWSSTGDAQMEEVGEGEEDVEGDETSIGVDGRESGVRERP